jgi:hypothetical protein
MSRLKFETTIANLGGAMEADTISKTLTIRGNRFRNTRKILFIVTIGVLMFGVNSCKSLDSSTLHPKMKSEKLLPPLTPVLDVESFASRFPLAVTYGAGDGVSAVSGTRSNPHIADFNLIFQRDVEKNISEFDLMGEEKKGTIKCSFIDASGKYKGVVWNVISWFTLGIPYLFGMPANVREDEMQIEVSIFDIENRLVGRYRSDVHKNTSYNAMYWGYKEAVLPHINYRLIFTKCMEDIKRQIEKDYSKLYDALNKG